MQYQRMLEIPETFPLPQLPGGFPASSPTHDHLTLRPISRPKSLSLDSNSHSHGAAARGLYCVYASDLQKHPDQPLADTYTRPDGDGRCPFCKFVISTRPGRAWEVIKQDDRRRDEERVFLVQQRFIVKCHREGGTFACVLCSRFRETDTACGETRALVDHLWKEHSCAELGKDDDIAEIG